MVSAAVTLYRQSLSLSLSLCPYLLSLFVPLRLQYMVTLRLITAVQLYVNFVNICIDLCLS